MRRIAPSSFFFKLIDSAEDKRAPSRPWARVVFRATVAAVLVALSLTTPSRRCDADLVSPFHTYATGGSPQSAAIGDINGDGFPDVVTANYAAGGVSVLLGDGTGGFGVNNDIATGADARDVALGDLNGDGHLDLQVVHYGPRTLAILLGRGDGTFGLSTNYACSAGPQAVAVGDLSGDGRLDVLVANLLGNSVSVFLGTGTGTLGVRTNWAVDRGPRSLAVCDLNADGRLDVVTANGGVNTVSWLPGDGRGGFATRREYATGSGPRTVVAADLNGDGRLDLAVPNASSNSLSVLVQGVGGFFTKVDYPMGGSPEYTAIGDFSGDGKLDVAVVRYLLNSVSISRGSGDGTFLSPAEYATGDGPLWVGAALLNGDSRADLVVANSAANSISVGLGGPPSARIVVSPDELNFGVRYVDHPDSLVMRVANAGSATLDVSAAIVSGAEFVLTGPSAFILTPGSHQDFTVTYPRAAAGAPTRALTFSSNDEMTPSKAVAVSGTSLALPMPSANPDTLRLTAAPGSVASGVITVTNGGSGSMSYSVQFAEWQPWLSWSPESGTLGPNESRSVTVVASAATLYGGLYSAAIRIMTSDLGLPRIDVPVQFTVTGEPSVTMNPEAIDFGWRFLGWPAERTLTILNSGLATLKVNSITGDGRFQPIAELPFEVGPSQSRGFSIIYWSVSPGVDTGLVVIASNAPTSPTRVVVTGVTLTPPAIRLAPVSLTFGLQPDQSASAVLTIRNDSAGELTFHIPSWGVPGSALARSDVGAEEVLSPSSSAAREGTRSPEAAAPGPEVAGTPANRNRTLVLSTSSLSSSIVHDSSNDLSWSIERCLKELQQGYDYLYTDDFTGIDFSPYARLIVGMDGGHISATSVQALAEAAAAGRRLIMIGGTNWEPYYDGLQAYLVKHTGGRGWVLTSQPQFRLVNAVDPLGWSLPGTVNFRNYRAGFYMVRANDPEATVVAVNGDGYASLLHKTIGAGELIYFTSSSYYVYWAEGADYVVLRKILENGLAFPSTQWLSVVPDSGTVPAHSSTNVEVRASSSQLREGEYLGYLHVRSNDPTYPELFVSVDLAVDIPTAAALSLTRSDADPERAMLEWYTPERNLTATLYRREATSDWSRLCDLHADGAGRIVYEDRNLVAGGHYGYRLGVRDEGSEHFYGEAWIDVPLPVLALYGASPNPATTQFTVAFSLPSRSPAVLDVFDIGGRRVASRAVGDLGAGRHELKFGDSERIEQGIYILCLSSDGRRLTTKIAVMK